ncbi:hypothetical protein B0H19DRAFT_1228992 [Mycena capillaripes]|nr:hypothetical protein B0H19DRAFT_1228992 [Mycena capillaripes]
MMKEGLLRENDLNSLGSQAAMYLSPLGPTPHRILSRRRCTHLWAHSASPARRYCRGTTGSGATRARAGAGPRDPRPISPGPVFSLGITALAPAAHSSTPNLTARYLQSVHLARVFDHVTYSNLIATIKRRKDNSATMSGFYSGPRGDDKTLLTQQIVTGHVICFLFK